MHLNTSEESVNDLYLSVLEYSTCYRFCSDEPVVALGLHIFCTTAGVKKHSF